uniref:Uncharacterized protein n=1 Tax=Rhizophagus irregularis (strain DAOM 181602 / DAOM 197198 / MUCL 43194) TaxID=747089 RepID=U9TKA2_RHIID
MSNIRRYTFQVHTAHESTRNYRKFFPVLKHISADGKLLHEIIKQIKPNYITDN